MGLFFFICVHPYNFYKSPKVNNCYFIEYVEKPVHTCIADLGSRGNSKRLRLATV